MIIEGSVKVRNISPYSSASFTVTNVSSPITLSESSPLQFTDQVPFPQFVKSVEITNTGSVTAYMAAGINGAVATASSSTFQAFGKQNGCYAIAPGNCKVIDIDPKINTIAFITATGTTTVEVTLGTGS